MNVSALDIPAEESVFDKLFSDKDTVVKILSKTDEECLVLAQHLRRKDHQISWDFDVMRGEVIYWLLSMYVKHGDSMALECRKYLHP